MSAGSARGRVRHHRRLSLRSRPAPARIRPPTTLRPHRRSAHVTMRSVSRLSVSRPRRIGWASRPPRPRRYRSGRWTRADWARTSRRICCRRTLWTLRRVRCCRQPTRERRRAGGDRAGRLRASVGCRVGRDDRIRRSHRSPLLQDRRRSANRACSLDRHRAPRHRREPNSGRRRSSDKPARRRGSARSRTAATTAATSRQKGRR